jgi:hypothetical protein
VPDSHFEDEVLVPEVAKPKSPNDPQSSTKITNLPIEAV